MKPRIKIDTTILLGIIALTGILLQFPGLYPKNYFLNAVLDFLGPLAVLTGMFFRMSARGYKKARSENGHGLVTAGPYSLVRNPMYLGTFLVGLGFILVVWPWYLLPVFATFFFQRFNIQIRKEESHLHKIFGASYEAYIQKVPGFFPRLRDLKKARYREIFPIQAMGSTKEKYGLLWGPFLVLMLEFLHRRIVP
ncbi:MAG TPA: isoprenylcysteine carboxylmethyltransferase family protein [Candidatus Omnitrophota bacterium]|nr:isoprenylcysteine carboxylmethyltransferase family protein [Candidatus Omnitrophota bacterium]